MSVHWPPISDFVYELHVVLGKAKLHLADLSKICLRHATTDKSVSGLATNGFVSDKSTTNPFEKTRHGFVYNILTCQDVVDKSVASNQSQRSILSCD